MARKKYVDNIPDCADCGGPLADDWDYSVDESFVCEKCEKKYGGVTEREEEHRRLFSPIDVKRWLD